MIQRAISGDENAHFELDETGGPLKDKIISSLNSQFKNMNDQDLKLIKLYRELLEIALTADKSYMSRNESYPGDHYIFSQ